MISSRNRQLAALGFIGGAACGALAWSHLQRQYRRDLFSARPLRRFAALSYLRTRPSMGTVRLLREYIAWERSQVLRERGMKLMRHVESTLP
ncbi:MAG TPA: hypothetical protein VHM24_10320 [Gemmatimonadaceae bacterium]|nr:hypothetical protein [Gemmatimonadaceae bacterium]